MFGWVHEHRPRADGGVRGGAAEEQVRRRLHPWQQRSLHQYAEKKINEL